MSCDPSYAGVYQPTVRPLPASSIAAIETLNRSRLFAGGTYFRSVDQGIGENDISLEIVITPGVGLSEDVVLTVRVLGIVQETFMISQTPPIFPALLYSGGISALRSAVGNVYGAGTPGSSIIEMQPRTVFPLPGMYDGTIAGGDLQDGGTDAADNGVIVFSDTYMSTGDGPPETSQPYLDSIFTGQERTIVIIDTVEDDDGFPIDPPFSLRVQQYDGTNFISYCNLDPLPGTCPLDGGCSIYDPP